MSCCSCTCVRSTVSKGKRRHADHELGIDLDLTFIAPNLVAMGFPSSGVESIYRNPYEDTLTILQKHYNEKYWVFNLCAEPQHSKYPEGKDFGGKVSKFPMWDHQACPLQQLCDAVLGVCNSLRTGKAAVVHCKAGKGRTGLVICCSLLAWDPKFFIPNGWEAVMRHYDTVRTKDGKGLTIASQRRYVHYFYQVLRGSGLGSTADLGPPLLLSSLSMFYPTTQKLRIQVNDIEIPITKDPTGRWYPNAEFLSNPTTAASLRCQSDIIIIIKALETKTPIGRLHLHTAFLTTTDSAPFTVYTQDDFDVLSKSSTVSGFDMRLGWTTDKSGEGHRMNQKRKMTVEIFPTIFSVTEDFPTPYLELLRRCDKNLFSS